MTMAEDALITAMDFFRGQAPHTRTARASARRTHSCLARQRGIKEPWRRARALICFADLKQYRMVAVRATRGRLANFVMAIETLHQVFSNHSCVLVWVAPAVRALHCVLTDFVMAIETFRQVFSNHSRMLMWVAAATRTVHCVFADFVMAIETFHQVPSNYSRMLVWVAPAAWALHCIFTDFVMAIETLH